MTNPDQTGEKTGAADQNLQPANLQPGEAKPITVPEDLQKIAVTGTDGSIMVPLAAAQDERTKRQTAEKALATREEELFLYKFNQPVAGTSPAPSNQGTAAETKPAETEPVKMGIPDVLNDMLKADPNQVLTAREVATIFEGVTLPAVNATDPLGDEKSMLNLGEQLLTLINSDAEKVLMGGFRARAIKEPHLLTIVGNAHPLIRPFLAYRLGSGEGSTQAILGSQVDATAATEKLGPDGKPLPANLDAAQLQKMAENAGLPGAMSKIAGQGAFSQVDRFMTMNTEDFEKEIERVKSA